ncbi:MAG: SIS domain-containing protein [Geminicoccaceae bacterium]
MFEEGVHAYLRRSQDVIGATIAALPEAAVQAAVEAFSEALGRGLPLLVCGNGGSAADAMHITGELVGRFLKERKALRAICLSDNPSVLTAWSNDYAFETVFSRQVEAYGAPGGAVLGISTSGNSGNVLKAFEAARGLGMATVGLTGEGGGRMAALSDHLLAVPSRSTPLIQQVHICLYHYLCARIEARLAG